MDANKGIELPPGTKISFYEVLPAVTGELGDVVRTCIGYGGFGALYRVSRGSKVFALKLAHQPLSAYSAAERQWVEERGDREIATLKSLRHPNIVRVHAFDRWPDDEGRAFIVMDFVDGDRLDVWRAKHSPSIRRICEVFIAIARALHTAHEQDIHHRDLKCANVLVRLVDGQPVIVDWGISKPGSSYTITRVNATMGTSTHFAPEYCRWALSPDNTRFETTPATELHAVGYMFYELLSGRGPFPFATNEVELMRTIITMDRGNGLKTPSELNQGSPKELDDVVMRLLEKQPEKRYQSGDELARDLDELLAHAPASWDSPLDMPLVSEATRATRADRGQLQHSVLELSKDDQPANPSALKPAPISIRSLERPGFLSIEAPAPVASPTPQLAPPLPDAIRAAAAKVGATAEPRRRLPRWAVVSIGLGLVLVGITTVAVLGRSERKQPENLLAKIERQEQLPADARSRTQPVEPASEPSLLPPAPKHEAVPRPESSGNTAVSGTDRRSSVPSDPARVDPPLQQHSGRANVVSPAVAKRGMSPAAQATRPSDDDDQPAWLKPVQTKVATLRANAKFGVPTGAHIKARLLTNLDSRTVAAGPVEAKLMRPFVLDGRSIFPSGTVLIGNAATSGNRFTIRFILLRLPDNREIAFEGLAYDVVERKPGLAATRRTDTVPTKGGEGVPAKVAKEAANTLLAAASGGSLGATLATGAGRTIVNEPGQDASTSVGDGTVLLLDAPTDLEVFVTRAM